MHVSFNSPRIDAPLTDPVDAPSTTTRARRTRVGTSPRDASEKVKPHFDGSKTSHEIAFGERHRGSVRPYEARVASHGATGPAHEGLSKALDRARDLADEDPRVSAEVVRLLKSLDAAQLDETLSGPAIYYSAAATAQQNLGVTSAAIKQNYLKLGRKEVTDLFAPPPTATPSAPAPIVARPIDASTGPQLSDERVASAIRRLEFMHVDNGLLDLASHYLQVLGRAGARVPARAEDYALASTALAMACEHRGVSFVDVVKAHGVAASKEHERVSGEVVSPDAFARTRLDAHDPKLATVLAEQVSIADAARAPRDPAIHETIAKATTKAKPTQASDLSLTDSLVFAQFLFASANYGTDKVPELANGWFPENALGAVHAYAHSIKTPTLPGTDISSASFREKMSTTLDLSRRYDAIEKLLDTTPHSANELFTDHAREIQRQVGQLRADGKDFVVVPFGHNIRLHHQTLPHQLYMTVTKTGDHAELRVFDRSLVSRINAGVSGVKFSEFALRMPIAEFTGPQGEQALAELLKRGLDGCSVETLLASPKTAHSAAPTQVSRPQSQQKAQNCTVASFTAVMNSLTDEGGYKAQKASLRKFAVENLLARDQEQAKGTQPELTATLRAIHGELRRLSNHKTLPSAVTSEYRALATKVAEHLG